MLETTNLSHTWEHMITKILNCDLKSEVGLMITENAV